jgi:hypothetical protein
LGIINRIWMLSISLELVKKGSELGYVFSHCSSLPDLE